MFEKRELERERERENTLIQHKSTDDADRCGERQAALDCLFFLSLTLVRQLKVGLEQPGCSIEDTSGFCSRHFLLLLL